ncbi:hypothetical protein L198_05278 [Cryptococcus wingfieldii CBS 7118]|uniref:Transcription factor TFIIIC triple barrel domain-containing protein n=1 Tax=Cryptococcus wingfieldii CBS 7118 TaxID=1295528 RepID=A0A1E3IXU2_9TREE|nr:hypothetical protein L198_05278 [Cryptococcus wingfieldii CBS 7118]ODN93414.1 hypothetical protein L198_05278 [Cryptococcus wingfieldii CBS 7118]
MQTETTPQALSSDNSLLGRGWTQVASFDELNEDEYEEEEEGMDTSSPFLRLGNQIFKGDITPLIGDEIICGHVRNHEDIHAPSHPPVMSTNNRITFQPITLHAKNRAPIHAPSAEASTSDYAVAGPGPSTAAAEGAVPAPPKRKGRHRRVIERPEDLNTFDLEAMGKHQTVELGPAVMEQLGIPPGTDGRGAILKKRDLERVLLGIPESKRGRKKKQPVPEPTGI